MSRIKEVIRSAMPRTIRPRRIVGGPLKSLWLVTSWHDYPAGLTGRTERPLLDWLAGHVRPGETWLDVGAHYGYTALALARLAGPAGRVFAFEPVAATAGCIDQARTLNGTPQMTVLPFGLGAVETLETRRIPITRGMADSTLSLQGTCGVAVVPVANFDWLWPRICGADATIHGIKIDIQGMELEALESMRDALARWRPRLVIELHAGVSRERVLALLGEVGYSRHAVAIDATRHQGKTGLLDDQSYAFEPL